jgi:undecaprenyl-diphosphatase
MDWQELAKAALFGLVEGVTEWLPISSTGHMLLLDRLVRLDVSAEFWDLFLVVIQLGAILSVLLLFHTMLNPFSRDKGIEQRRDTWRLWAQVVVACVPAAAVGIPLDDWMEEHLGSPQVIAIALIVYGIAFIVIETLRERATMLEFGGDQQRGARHLATSPSVMSPAERADARARVQRIEDLDWPSAMGIGLFQVLSLVPGTSRSGSTIIGGLIIGCSRVVASEFTFFLAIPVMFGASALRLLKYFLRGNVPTMGEWQILGVGCVVSFVVSLACIRLLMSFVRRHDFKPFGWYRIVLGVVVFVVFALFG